MYQYPDSILAFLPSLRFDCFASSPKEPITDPFGFPLRLRTSTKLGFKNPKWIVALEVTNNFPETYYSKEGFNWFSGI